jgi:hypothetical protein
MNKNIQDWSVIKMTEEPVPSDYVKLLPEVRGLVSRIVQRNMAEGIMFSAGTDTSMENPMTKNMWRRWRNFLISITN